MTFFLKIRNGSKVVVSLLKLIYTFRLSLLLGLSQRYSTVGLSHGPVGLYLLKFFFVDSL